MVWLLCFLFTGTFGALCTGAWYFTKEVRGLENNKTDYQA